MGDYGDVYMRKEAAGPPGRTKAQNRATVQQLKLVSKTSLCRADATTLNLICPVFWLYVWGWFNLSHAISV
jgi:U1 small nuclear ribonucleoprotein